MAKAREIDGGAWGAAATAPRGGEAPLAAVYSELRGVARALMRRESEAHTLQPTALLHEAFLRLANQGAMSRFDDRAYFFSAVAKAMREVLVDHARRRTATKRGGGWKRHTLDEVLDSCGVPPDELPALSDAIGGLEAIDARAARVVDLRFFGGFSEAEVAAELGVSTATVQRSFQFARAWLRRSLRGQTGR